MSSWEFAMVGGSRNDVDVVVHKLKQERADGGCGKCSYDVTPTNSEKKHIAPRVMHHFEYFPSDVATARKQHVNVITLMKPTPRHAYQHGNCATEAMS